MGRGCLQSGFNLRKDPVSSGWRRKPMAIGRQGEGPAGSQGPLPRRFPWQHCSFSQYNVEALEGVGWPRHNCLSPPGLEAPSPRSMVPGEQCQVRSRDFQEHTRPNGSLPERAQLHGNAPGCPCSEPTSLPLL